MSNPPPPTPFPNPMYVSPSSATFYWAHPSDLSGGSLVTNYRFSIPSFLSVDLNSYVFSYHVTDLQHGVTITPEIQSSSDNGITWGPAASFPPFTPINPPPLPPASVEALPLSPGTAQISWTPPETPPEGNAYYFVESSSSNSSDPTMAFGSENLSITSCTLSELNPNSSYTFRICIVNPVGRSPSIESNSISF